MPGSARSSSGHIVHQAQSQGSSEHAESFERRGRSATKRDVTFKRHTELVKNIQRVESQPPYVRSRETSVHSVHTANSGGETRSTQRFKHPMSAYNNESGVDTIAPSKLYKHYQLQQASESRRSVSHVPPAAVHNRLSARSHTCRTKDTTILLDNELVPAFDAMRMDLEEDADGGSDGRSSNVNGHGSDDDDDYSISEDGSMHDLHVSIDIDNRALEDFNDTTEVNSRRLQIPQTQGRIQHKITALKLMQESEEQNTFKRQFSTIEQKTLLNSLNNDLQSLRRCNYRPMLDSVKRVTRRNVDDVREGDNHSEHYGFVKTYSAMEPIDFNQGPKPHYKHHSKASEVDIDRLKILLGNSVKVLESLWVDEPERYISNKSSTTTGQSQSQGSSLSRHLHQMTFETIAEDGTFDLMDVKHNTDGGNLRAQLDGYELNKPHIAQRLSGPSPHTMQT